MSNNDVAQAAEKFYDAGDISNVRKLLNDSAAKWDGSAFGADRYGQLDATSMGPSMLRPLQMPWHQAAKNKRRRAKKQKHQRSD